MSQTVVISPRSVAYADTTNGNTYPTQYVGATNSRREEMIGVVASLAANSSVHLVYELPPTLAATPNATFRLRMRAAATSGAAKYIVNYGVVATGSNPDTATLTASATQTATAAVSDGYLTVDTAITVAQADAAKTLFVDLAFQTTSWTLAVKAGFVPLLIIDVA